MYAWEVDRATIELRGLRQEEWVNAALAALAFGFALGASGLAPSLAVPLLVGGLASTFLAVRAFWRRWDLLDRLALDRDAYRIREVRLVADRSATMETRHVLAASIRRLLEHPGYPCAARVRADAEGLEALARELDDPALSLDPACAVACKQLLTEATVSPLFNEALPADDAGARVRQIRAGFEPLRKGHAGRPSPARSELHPHRPAPALAGDKNTWNVEFDGSQADFGEPSAAGGDDSETFVAEETLELGAPGQRAQVVGLGELPVVDHLRLPLHVAARREEPDRFMNRPSVDRPLHDRSIDSVAPCPAVPDAENHSTGVHKNAVQVREDS